MYSATVNKSSRAVVAVKTGPIASAARDTAALRALFMIGLSDATYRTHKAVKGLKTCYIPAVLVVGEHNGLSNADYASITNKPRSNTYAALQRVITAGWITKTGARYYLTARGQIAYAVLCREFETTWKQLTAELTKRIQSKLSL